MRIAIICDGAGYISRGVESWAFEMSRRLNARGHDVKVFGSGDADWVVKVHSRFRVTDAPMQAYDAFMRAAHIQGALLRIGLPWFPMSMLHVVDRLFSEAAFRQISEAGEKFDVFLCPGVGAARVHHRFKAKVGGRCVAVVQGSVARRNEAEYLRPEFQDAVTVLTPEAARVLREEVGYKGRVEAIPNGVDLKRFRPGVAPLQHPMLKARNLPRPVFLSTSAFEPFKRIDLLIQAVAKLGSGSLILVGSGSQRARLAAMGEKLLGDRFACPGPVSYSEIDRVYALCDVFCLPSQSEAFGNVMVEAMAENKPIVSQDDVNRRFVVGGGGVLADLSDPAAFAAALEKAAKTGWGDKPRKQAEKFSWERTADLYESLITGICSGRPRSA